MQGLSVRLLEQRDLYAKTVKVPVVLLMRLCSRAPDMFHVRILHGRIEQEDSDVSPDFRTRGTMHGRSGESVGTE